MLQLSRDFCVAFYLQVSVQVFLWCKNKSTMVCDKPVKYVVWHFRLYLSLPYSFSYCHDGLETWQKKKRIQFANFQTYFLIQQFSLQDFHQHNIIVNNRFYIHTKTFRTIQISTALDLLHDIRTSPYHPLQLHLYDGPQFLSCSKAETTPLFSLCELWIFYYLDLWSALIPRGVSSMKRVVLGTVERTTAVSWGQPSCYHLYIEAAVYGELSSELKCWPAVGLLLLFTTYNQPQSLLTNLGWRFCGLGMVS